MTNTNISNFSNPIIYLAIFGVFVAANVKLAHAEIDWTGMYSGIVFSNSKDKFEPDGAAATTESRGHLKGKLGKYLNDYFSVEGQFGLTSNSGQDQGISTLGVYLRANKDFGKYTLYGLVGYSGIYAYDDDVPNVNESGGSYGVGLEIFGSKNLALTFEYISLLDKSVNGGDPDFGAGDLSFDTLGIGLTYYFIEDKSNFNKNRDKIRSIRY